MITRSQLKAALKSLSIISSQKPESDTLVDRLYDRLVLIDEGVEIIKTPFNYEKGDIEVLARAATNINNLDESKTRHYEPYFDNRYRDWICLVLEIDDCVYSYTKKEIVMALRGINVHKSVPSKKIEYLRRFLEGDHFKVLFYDVGHLAECARNDDESDWFSNSENTFDMIFQHQYTATLQEAISLGIIRDQWTLLKKQRILSKYASTMPPTDYLKNKDVNIYERIKKQHDIITKNKRASNNTTNS